MLVHKKYRKLSKEQKFALLIKEYKISENEIFRIRTITDSKMRLLEAAKLQIDCMGDIHSDIVAWIAGYAQETSVRANFGSALELRKHFVNIPADIKNYSWMDIKRNVKIPPWSEDLAEETGIHLGDGSLQINRWEKWNNYVYSIDGHLVDDMIYYDSHVIPLIQELYNLTPRKRINKNRNSCQLELKSKAVILFKKNVLKLPVGNKINAEIPKEIFENRVFSQKFVCGIIDTDFTITKDMQIRGSLVSLNIIRGISKILNTLNMSHYVRISNEVGYITINKPAALELLEEVKNPKHTSKYLLWQRYHKYFPFTSTIERLAVLENIMPFEHLLELSEKRKNARAMIRATPPVRISASSDALELTTH
jgi:hypothetical protein